MPWLLHHHHDFRTSRHGSIFWLCFLSNFYRLLHIARKGLLRRWFDEKGKPACWEQTWTMPMQCYWYMPTKKFMRKWIQSVPAVEIKLANFGTFQRAATLRFSCILLCEIFLGCFCSCDFPAAQDERSQAVINMVVCVTVHMVHLLSIRHLTQYYITWTPSVKLSRLRKHVIKYPHVEVVTLVKRTW